VRIRRKSYELVSDLPIETGVVLCSTYMAYDPANSKWKVLVGDIVKEVQGKNLFTLDQGV
jgi:hypothetical protein